MPELVKASGYGVPMTEDWKVDFPFVAEWLPGSSRYAELPVNAFMAEAWRSAGWTKQVPFLVRMPDEMKPHFNHLRGNWMLWACDAADPMKAGSVITIKDLNTGLPVQKVDERIIKILVTLTPALRDKEKSLEEDWDALSEKAADDKDARIKADAVDKMMHAATADPGDPERRDFDKVVGNTVQVAVADKVSKKGKK